MISDSTVALFSELEGAFVTPVSFLVDSHPVVGGVFLLSSPHGVASLYLVGDLLDFRLGPQEVGMHRDGSLYWAILVNFSRDPGTVRDTVETVTVLLVTFIGRRIARLPGLAALGSISAPPIAWRPRATEMVLTWQCVCVCV